jgi:hypothetical protein
VVKAESFWSFFELVLSCLRLVFHTLCALFYIDLLVVPVPVVDVGLFVCLSRAALSLPLTVVHNFALASSAKYMPEIRDMVEMQGILVN